MTVVTTTKRLLFYSAFHYVDVTKSICSLIHSVPDAFNNTESVQKYILYINILLNIYLFLYLEY